MEEYKYQETENNPISQQQYLTLENGFLILENAKKIRFGAGNNTIKIDNTLGFWTGNQIYSIAPLRMSSTGTLYSKTSVLTSAYYDIEFNGGNTGSAGTTLNWANSNKQVITLTGSGTITMTAPPGPANLLVRLVQDASSGRTVVWSPLVKWSGSSILSTGSSATDIASFYYAGGTAFYGILSTNFV